MNVESGLLNREPGTVCRLGLDWWDGELPLPIPGDFLRTASGTCYRIEEVRLARPGSKRIATLVCTRLERDAVTDGAPGVWAWQFSARR